MEVAKVKAEEAEAEIEAEQLEVAAILCDLSRLVRAQDWRKRRRERARTAAMDALRKIPSWGRRRPRSMPEYKSSPPPLPAPPAPAPAPAAEAAVAASPDTPLAYPESSGDDAPPPKDKDKGQIDAVRPLRDQSQWAEEQHGETAAASLSPPPENARPLLQVARRKQEQDPPPAPALELAVVDLNEPARAAAEEQDEQLQQQLQAQRARVAAAATAAAAEWYRQVQLHAALQKAAVSAGARRRRLQILRAKAACPLVSSRMRRAG